MNVNKFKSVPLLAFTLLFLLAVAGCGAPSDSKSSDSVQEKVTVSSTVQEEQNADRTKNEEKDTGKEHTVTVYFPNNNGTRLVAEKRKVAAKKDKYMAAMEELMKGTKDKDKTVIIPKNAKMKSVKVLNGIAKVDFSKEFQTEFAGGSTGEEMLIGSIVDTLTEFDDVQKVRFLIEGKEIDSLCGHMDLSEPIARMTKLLK